MLLKIFILQQFIIKFFSLYNQIDALNQIDTIEYTPEELENHNNQIMLLEVEIEDLKEEKYIAVSNDNLLEITSTKFEENTLTVYLSGLAIGTSNLFITNTMTRMFIDYLEVNIFAGTPDIEPIIYEFDLNNQQKTELIRGSEAFMMFTPNSYGAFVDAYKYGKLEFISTNINMIEIYSSIDGNNNIIVKLVAIGFNINPELSFSMIRIRLFEASIGDYLVNQRVNIDIGAVQGMQLHANSTSIAAVPDENGTQWLTPIDPETGEQDPLKVYVTFSDPDEPAVIGVQYVSSDTSILEIDDNIIDEDGNPKWLFKKAGQVTLTAKSLDPYAIPTNPAVPGDGAYAFIILNVTTPSVIEEFKYSNLVGESEQIVAGDEIDLLKLEIVDGAELKPRVKVMRSDFADYTNLVNFALESSSPAVTLTEIPANETFETSRKNYYFICAYWCYGCY